MSNINDISEIKCTGCGACITICPKNIIQMKKSLEGFFYASIDQSQCIECGLCKQVCHRYDQDESNSIFLCDAYMAYSKDAYTLKSSTSGGIGTEIAKWGIENDYKVVGAEYDCDSHLAKHIIIDKIQDIEKIKGSKYLQSKTDEAFREIIDGQKYILIGTPCQIYGMKKVAEMKKINENIIFVDFFCHGIPTYRLWDKYLSYISKRFGVRKINNVLFRSKDVGWHTYLMKIKHEQGIYKRTGNKDLFYKFYFDESCIHESCYSCRYRFNQIHSDIRLGDFWGEYCADNDQGVSVILTHTEKGKKLLRCIKDKLEIYNIDFEEIRKVKEGNKGIKPIPKHRNKVINKLKNDDKLTSIYLKYIFPSDIKKEIKNKLKQIIVKVNKAIKSYS